MACTATMFKNHLKFPKNPKESPQKSISISDNPRKESLTKLKEKKRKEKKRKEKKNENKTKSRRGRRRRRILCCETYLTVARKIVGSSLLHNRIGMKSLLRISMKPKARRSDRVDESSDVNFFSISPKHSA